MSSNKLNEKFEVKVSNGGYSFIARKKKHLPTIEKGE